ncbi:MAG TPA: tRNA (adenosine(37)-N6)-threonylcarbamoyltransferase complex ATPase subunit type 1 TsaE [Acidimicrobiia bacterium]|nr:tRNA (adenosine(37)-N6)-threonylcarbamoyltransferase complex ATPase subunit type 1 TsaE [Acidimicrobiia bacterium]
MMFTTRGAQETESVGAALGQFLHEGDLVVIGGDLGAGKTTFVKGVARALGVRDPVTSPTFTIVQEYEGRVPVAHVDIYRLQRVQELHDLGLEEMLDDRVVLVEWGDVVAPLLPLERVEVQLTAGEDPDVRTIEIVLAGPEWTARRDALDDALASVRST